MEKLNGLVKFSAFMISWKSITMYVAFFYLVRHVASEQPDSTGWAYILFNEAKSHLPKVHLHTPKRKVTFRLALKVDMKTRVKLEKVEVGQEN